MAHRCVRRLRLPNPGFPHVRHFHSSPAHRVALALPLAESSTATSTSSSSRENALDVLRRHKLKDLNELLARRSVSENRVWASYLDLLQYYGTTKVPLEIHQSVLRKCAPSAAYIRFVSSQRVAMGRRYNEYLLYESRYQRIIRNIRAAGDLPSLEDYHWVLKLFAAVGNHKGAMMVLGEIGRVGLAKDEQTYGLCLQALSYRLTLPVWHADRQALVADITQDCIAIMNEMTTGTVPYIPLNIDLAFRIFKETLDTDSFARVLRNAFGIDLEYPDRSPLENWGKLGDPATQADGQATVPAQAPAQLPFTIHAFNTALDYLARTDDVSTLVQFFEVLTTRLPSTASNSNTFEDEDDDDFGISNPQVAPYKPPHVRANSTSYRLLLRGVCKADHFTFARHYLLVAMSRERKSNRLLCEMARELPPAQLPRPHLSINRSIFLPVVSLAKRNKDMELLRFLVRTIKRVGLSHRADIHFFTACRTRWIEAGVYRPSSAVDIDSGDNVGDDLPSAASSSQFSTFFSPSSSSRETSTPSDPPSSNSESEDVAPPVQEEKAFDVDLHLRILRRELVDLEDLLWHVRVFGLGRTAQRMQEYLGRRVWNEKDIYVPRENRRTVVSKEWWRANVKFRSQSEIEAKANARRSTESGVKPPSSRAGGLGETREHGDRDELPHLR